MFKKFTQYRTMGAAVPPQLLVLASMLSVQFGAAIAKGLFEELGPGGAVLLRASFAAGLLVLFWRPALRGHSRRAWLLALVYGASLGFMNLSFYAAISRIPLGVAVTIEFVGPLGVALLGSRRWRDLLWAGLAAAGILLLAPFENSRLDSLGVLLALFAGGLWAAYILLSGRVARAFPGSSGLALSMCVAALILLPVGMGSAGGRLVEPRFLLLGLAVAVLSSFIPYSLEFEALRRMPPRVFGILMSLEPAFAALVGLFALGETPHPLDWLAILLVSLAAAGASADHARRAEGSFTRQDTSPPAA